MKNNIKIKIAIGTNNNFTIIDSKKIKDISLKNTYRLVNYKDEIYPLYTGVTPKDSQKINELLKKAKN